MKQIADILPREHIVVPLAARTLRAALEEIVTHLGDIGAIRDVAGVRAAMDAHRARDIVQIGARVLLPHYRTDAVEHLVVAFGIAPEPLSVDGAQTGGVSIVVLILSPLDAATLYLQTVAALARLFRQEAVTTRLAQARTPDEVLDIAELARLKIQPRLSVRDFMIHGADHVSPDTLVRDAVDTMVRKRLRAMPVVGDKGQVLGIISEWDVMRALLPQIPRAGGEEGPPENPPQLRVRDIMTRSVLCISEDLGLSEAANMMINKDVEQFPVVSEGNFTGLLTRSDIIRKLFGR